MSSRSTSTRSSGSNHPPGPDRPSDAGGASEGLDATRPRRLMDWRSERGLPGPMSATCQRLGQLTVAGAEGSG